MQTRFGQAKGKNLGQLRTNKIWAGKGGKFWSFKIQPRFGQAKGENLGHLKYKQDLGKQRGKI